MKVWGNHTKGMDHLQKRAAEQIDDARANQSSVASRMDKLSIKVQREVLNDQRERGRTLGRDGWKKNGL